jgi:nitrite reductase/ring-hydroxylating ferredoxin subunit
MRWRPRRPDTTCRGGCGRVSQDNPLPEPAQPTRRKALEWLTVGLSAVIGLALSAGPLAMLLHPLLKRRTRRPGSGWRLVGPVSRFAIGGPPTRIVITEDRTDAWLSRPGTPVGPVVVERLDEASFRIFSGVCPHLGCSVGVQPGETPYLCPCHRSRFSSDGARLESNDGEPNPAPRRLDELEWRVEQGKLTVNWVRYRPGTSAQVPIA